MIRCLLPLFLLVTVLFTQATDESANKCTTKKSEDGKKRLCFFALNGPQESQTIKTSKAGLKCIQPEDGSNIECGTETEEGTDVKLEIQEFYADVKQNESVSQAFEEMTQTACDGLVISGYHAGYYTGKQTSRERNAQGNRDASQVALNLKFLEKLSCLQGNDGDSDCRQWFANIKYLHLHGSHTSGHKVLETEDVATTDDLALSRMKKYNTEVWTRASAQYLNREYASTVDENNSLSSRYLKMFPSAQIYSWAVAPTIEQGSPQTFIDHLKLMATHTDIATGEGSTSPASKGLENILNILSLSGSEPKCIKLQEGDHQGTVIHSDSDREQESQKRKIGCDFSEAIESKNKDKIMRALDEVLRVDALHENLNRIFYALNYDSLLSAEVKEAVRQKLKAHQSFDQAEAFKQALAEQVGDNKTGVVKRADALYLYKQIYSEDGQFGNLENKFVEDLISLYDRQEKDTVGRAMKGMIAELIWKNNLGGSSASKTNIQTLIDKLGAEENIHLRQNAELMRISSGLYQANTSEVGDIFEELFSEEGNEFRNSQFFIKLWTDLQAQNKGDFTPVQKMYDSALKATQKESDPVRKKELTKKFANIILGVSSGFTVRKEECLKAEFPLKEDQLKVPDESRTNMISLWRKFCNK